jgi:hypothetical protein
MLAKPDGACGVGPLIVRRAAGCVQAVSDR